MTRESSAEAMVLHDVLDGREEDALARLYEFLPGELVALSAACDNLGALCRQVLTEPRANLPRG